MTVRILDVSAKFKPDELGSALKKFWVAEHRAKGMRLVPATDSAGRPTNQCPITCAPMADPVLLSDGLVYEREHILKWLQNHNEAPHTQEPLKHKTVLRLAPLGSAIERLVSNLSCSSAASSRLWLEKIVETARTARPSERLQALDSLEMGIAESTAEIAQWQAEVARGKELVAQLRLGAAACATSLMAAAARSFLARSLLLSLTVVHAARTKAASQIQARWRAIKKRRAKLRAQVTKRHHLRQQLHRLANSPQRILSGVEALAELSELYGYGGGLLPWLFAANRPGAPEEVMRVGGEILIETVEKRDGPRALASIVNNQGVLNVEPGVLYSFYIDHCVARLADVSGGMEVGGALLVVAIQHDYPTVVQLLLSNGAGANAVMSDGCSALWLACSYGSVPMSRQLLKARADMDTALQDGSTALHMASQNDHEGITRLLLGVRVAVDTRMANGCTALHIASMHGHTRVAEQLLDRRASSQLVTNDGSTPMHMASASAHDSVLRLLLRHEASIEATLPDGSTALHTASLHGHEGILQALLDHRARLDATGEAGATALHIASVGGHCETIRLILAQSATVNATDDNNKTALHVASENDHESVVRTLLDARAAVNAQTSSGATSLFMAVDANHVRIVEMLLDHRAVVDTTNRDGTTVFHAASVKGNSEMVSLLFGRGAKGAGPEFSRSALRIAIEHGFVSMVQQLLDGRGDVDVVLQAASEYGDVTSARMALNRGADTEAILPDGRTALYNASERGHTDLADLLLDYGAAVDAASREGGKTALQAASMSGHTEVVRLLLDRGADVNFTTLSGSTALQVAGDNGHESVVEALLECAANVHIPIGCVDTMHRHASVTQPLLDHGASESDGSAEVQASSQPG